MPVKLDQYQTIVNVHWPVGEYVAFSLSMQSATYLPDVSGITCSGGVSPNPGNNSSGYETGIVYNYSAGGYSSYDGEDWRTASSVVVGGLRTTDTVGFVEWTVPILLNQTVPGVVQATRFSPNSGDALQIPIPDGIGFFYPSTEVVAEAMTWPAISSPYCATTGLPPDLTIVDIDPALISPIGQTPGLLAGITITSGSRTYTVVGTHAVQNNLNLPNSSGALISTNCPKVLWVLARRNSA